MSGFIEESVIPLFAQAIMYGLYVGTSAHCLRWLLFDDTDWNVRKKINWTMLTIAIVLFILMTMNLWTALQLTVGPVLQVNVLASNQTWLVPVDSVTAIAIRLIFDMVLVYRCWVVWDRSRRIACIPLLLWIACLASAILALYYDRLLAYTRSGKELFFARRQIYRFHMVFYSCNIATNIYATTAIVYRIMRITGMTGNRGLNRICRILIESGTPYTLSSAVILVATALAERNQSFAWGIVRSIAEDINFSVASIAFNLILIRAAQTKLNRERPKRLHSTFQNSKPIALSFPSPRLEDQSTILVTTEQRRTYDSVGGSA